ncbi:MAG: nickel pincer cofactor biosynthesis protein LarB [Frankiaceae bacterium]|nr:nickel pincer cofactor biosynthesis protein LarB [Frankiaceae bacterium]MBV9871259.1 nickel pincer cofactor biosynthesis protein LarB [Frankiaceae bacterium]
MDADELRSLLDGVASGATSVDAAARALSAAPLSGFLDLGFAKLDHHRGMRTGDPEVVYAAGKTDDQVIALLTALREAPGERPAMATRLTPSQVVRAREAFPGATVDEAAGCIVIGEFPTPRGEVVVLSAGTSDERVAAEAALVARAFGAGVRRVTDVGVAGIHRLLAERDGLTEADCLVVVAGMEGALPSVVGGLVGTPIVAVPTSVGYGASFGGIAALLGMLNSCAPGVTVVNIDNGFGAGVFAARVARRSTPRTTTDTAAGSATAHLGGT